MRRRVDAEIRERKFVTRDSTQIQAETKLFVLLVREILSATAVRGAVPRALREPCPTPTIAVVSTYRMDAVTRGRRFVIQASTTTPAATRMFAAIAPEIHIPTAARGAVLRALQEPSPPPTTAVVMCQMDAATRGRRIVIQGSTTTPAATRMFASIAPQVRLPMVAPGAVPRAALERFQTPITAVASSAARERFPTPAIAPAASAVRERSPTPSIPVATRAARMRSPTPNTPVAASAAQDWFPTPTTPVASSAALDRSLTPITAVAANADQDWSPTPATPVASVAAREWFPTPITAVVFRSQWHGHRTPGPSTWFGI